MGKRWLSTTVWCLLATGAAAAPPPAASSDAGAEKPAVQISPDAPPTDVAPGAKPATDAPPAIIARWTDAGTWTYVEHAGPYWRLAGTLQRVRSARTKAAGAGPIAIRYPPLPAPGEPAGPSNGRQAGSPALQVGFVSVEPPRVPEGFAQCRWPARLVAQLELAEVPRSTNAYHAQLRAWAAEQGHNNQHEIIELYYPPPPQSTQVTGRTVIQLVLVAGERPAQAAAAAASKPAAAVPATAQATPTTGQAPTPPPAPAAKPAVEPVDPSLSLAELIEDGSFDQAAARLLPAEQPWNRPRLVWWERCLFRLGAIGKALDQQARGSDSTLQQLTTALQARLRGQTGQLDLGGGATSVRPSPAGPPAPGVPARELLTQLDALLGRAVLGEVDGPGALAAVVVILERTQPADPAPTDGASDPRVES